MNDRYIVTTYVVIDTVLKAYGFVDDCRAIGTAAEILMVSVIAPSISKTITDEG